LRNKNAVSARRSDVMIAMYKELRIDASSSLVIALVTMTVACGNPSPRAVMGVSTPTPVASVTPTEAPPTLLYSVDGPHLRAYRVDAKAGTLSPAGVSDTQPGLAYLQSDPSGRSLFEVAVQQTCCHSPLDFYAYRYDIASDGSVSTAGRMASFSVDDQSAAPAVADRFLYFPYTQYEFCGIGVVPVDRSTRDLASYLPSLLCSDQGDAASSGVGPVYIKRVVVSADGRSLFSAENDRDDNRTVRLVGYALGDDGLGSIQSSIAIDEQEKILSLAVHPNGRLLFAGAGGRRILVYETGGGDSTCRLCRGLGIFETATSPTDLLVDPSGHFLFVYTAPTYQTTPQAALQIFAIDATSGSLKLVTTRPTTPGSTGYHWAVDPSGLYLFGRGNADKHILGYRLDPETGSLHPFETEGTGDPMVMVRAQ
jgi:6-phosphogluconolactonase (cycloisomerase 2 family)